MKTVVLKDKVSIATTPVQMSKAAQLSLRLVSKDTGRPIVDHLEEAVRIYVAEYGVRLSDYLQYLSDDERLRWQYGRWAESTVGPLTKKQCTDAYEAIWQDLREEQQRK